MILLRSTHQALLASAEEVRKVERHQLEAQISQLRDHIKDLRSLVFAPTTSQPTPVAREADAILTPVNDSPVIEYSEGAEDELRERDRIFSGEFEEVIA